MINMSNVNLEFIQVAMGITIICDICQQKNIQEKNLQKPHLTPQPNYEVTPVNNEEANIYFNNMLVLNFEPGEIKNICWNCIDKYKFSPPNPAIGDK
jgi:hypothetical protein